MLSFCLQFFLFTLSHMDAKSIKAAPRFLLGQGVDGTWNGEEGTENREPRGQ
jgi:hypothetical protein